jgi:hypothetical protein
MKYFIRLPARSQTCPTRFETAEAALAYAEMLGCEAEIYEMVDRIARQVMTERMR